MVSNWLRDVGVYTCVFMCVRVYVYTHACIKKCMLFCGNGDGREWVIEDDLTLMQSWCSVTVRFWSGESQQVTPAPLPGHAPSAKSASFSCLNGFIVNAPCSNEIFLPFTPPLTISLFCAPSCCHSSSHSLTQSYIYTLISVPLLSLSPLFPTLLFLSCRYRLPVSKDGVLCMIEIVAANGTANRSQKYVSEPSSEVNPILLLIPNELGIYAVSLLHWLSSAWLWSSRDPVTFWTDGKSKLRFRTQFSHTF